MAKKINLWSYQHPKVVEILQSGVRYYCTWDKVHGENWKKAFAWMARQMNNRQIHLPPENAPIWAWHSVNEWQGKPDAECANALLSDLQREAGVVLLTLQVPIALALLSSYHHWNEVLDNFLDGTMPKADADISCFLANETTKRQWSSAHFHNIQACLPYIEPKWLVSVESI